MVDVLSLYIDDSGTRHPDRDPGRAPGHGYDWFALGGIMIREPDEAAFRADHAAFCAKWDINAPLRSADIRAHSGNFHWLKGLSNERRESFYEELYHLMSHAPTLGIACVIDRPGYNARYREKYGRERWMLCKTAFNVVVERAAKHAMTLGCKLDVNVEKGDKKTDAVIRGYYKDLRAKGMPFDAASSSKYEPMGTTDIAKVVYDLRFKGKSSPLMQLADLYLWPMCMGGYNPQVRPYQRLIEDKKLIDSVLGKAEIPVRGIKYSCWELVQTRQKN